MTTIFDVIKRDHDDHRRLLAELEETEGASEERERLFAQFATEMESHANAEEQTFYAALIATAEGQEKARHSVAEHKEAADLLDQLRNTELSSSGWLKTFRKLKEELEHHMDEEEDEVFPLARRVLSKSEHTSLAGDFQARKGQEQDMLKAG